jgi:hypothetical protein
MSEIFNDYFHRVPSHLAWDTLHVVVRQQGGKWQFSYGYQFTISGMGTPFMGALPSREAAGRNGMLYLRDDLRRFSGADPDRRDDEQKQAAKLADEIHRQLCPSQR